jgi:hypothetical protein
MRYLALLVAAALPWLSACTTNPDTGEQEPHQAIAPVLLLTLEIDTATQDDQITDQEIVNIVSAAELVVAAIGVDSPELGVVLTYARGNVSEIRAALESDDPAHMVRAAIAAYLRATMETTPEASE